MDFGIIRHSLKRPISVADKLIVNSSTLMRRTLIVANWKMNGRKAMAAALCSAIVENVQACNDLDVAICPPFTLLDAVNQIIAGRGCMLGSQDLDRHDDGAYTGQISAGMLKDCGCELVIIGHSERRSLFEETDKIVCDKAMTALKHGIQPIICVGETKDERKAGKALSVVQKQVQFVIDEIGIQAFADAIIAYEPIWAIGTGLTPTPEEAQTMHFNIRGIIRAQHRGIAETSRILYGGSMNQDNAGALLGCPDIDGGLVGGASLSADQFLGICRAA